MRHAFTFSGSTNIISNKNKNLITFSLIDINSFDCSLVNLNETNSALDPTSQIYVTLPGYSV